MNVNLRAVLDDIPAARHRDWRNPPEIEERLSMLVKDYGGNDLAEPLMRDIPTDVPVADIADLFSLLILRTHDNGSSIRRSASRWLSEPSDSRRVKVALSIEFVPFTSESEAQQALSQLQWSMPEMAADCARVLRQWREISDREALQEGHRHGL